MQAHTLTQNVREDWCEPSTHHPTDSLTVVGNSNLALFVCSLVISVRALLWSSLNAAGTTRKLVEYARSYWRCAACQYMHECCHFANQEPKVCRLEGGNVANAFVHRGSKSLEEKGRFHKKDPRWCLG